MKKALVNHPLGVYPDFRRLFAGRIISAVGDKFFAITIAWWVLSGAGEHGKFHLGMIMAMTFLPVVLFGPFFGALVDRSDKRLSMLWADAARLTLVFTLALLTWSDRLELWMLYGLCFMIAGFGPMFEASVASSLLRLTSEEHLGAATAADSSVMQLSNVFGSALGSIFLAVLGAAGAFFFNSLTYALSFIVVWLIVSDLRPRRGEQAPYFDELKAGLRYIAGNRPLLVLLLSFAALNFFVGPILILIPMIVKFVINGSVKWLAIFETFFAAGSALAAIVLSFRGGGCRRVYHWFFASLLAMGLPFLGLYFTTDRWLICGLLFVMGTALGAGNAVVLTLFQRTVPEEMKGRFFSVLTTVSYAVLPLTFMLNGLLAESRSVGFSLLMNSCALLALSSLVLFIPRLEYGETE
ncbi:MAG: major facilitator superfamily protein [Elusimicrobia bacterium]|nr:MAG: major facilitator superfamily protein [Elusimicrobiota bacterium]KAF0154901.1 MAG: major facilitator superfamily protein [Elusimicrobiota bacterium]